MAGPFDDALRMEAEQSCRQVICTLAQQSALAELVTAKRRGVAKLVRMACEHAQAAGVPCHITDESFAHARQLYLHKVHAAVKSSRLKRIVTACRRAEAVGVDADEMEMARSTAWMLSKQDLASSFYQFSCFHRFAEACKFARVVGISDSEVTKARISAAQLCMSELTECERDVNVERFLEVVHGMGTLNLFADVDLKEAWARARVLCMTNVAKVSRETCNAYDLQQALDFARHVGVSESDLEEYESEVWDRIERDEGDCLEESREAEAMEALLHSLRGCGCVDRMEDACAQASSLHVANALVEEILAEARQLRTRELSLARQRCDVANIEETCSVALNSKMHPSVIREAFMEAGQVRALADLSEARSSGNKTQIESACMFAELAGVVLPPEIVAEARAEANLFHAQAELCAARQTNDCARIERACQMAELAGVDRDQIEQGKKDAQRLHAEMSIQKLLRMDMWFLPIGEVVRLSDDLEKASELVPPNRFALAKRAFWARFSEATLCHNLVFGNVEAAQNSCDHVESFCAKRELAYAARSAVRRLSELEERQLAYASDAVEAALLVGVTDYHNRLAGALGRVVAKCEDNSGAMDELTNQLQSGQRLFDPRSSCIFSLDGEVDFGLRTGWTYFKPRGWLRFGIFCNPSIFDLCKDWPVAYHGTMKQNVVPILMKGLRRPGDPGVMVSTAHGAAYSKHGETIYLSPSIEYAAFPVYAQLFSLDQKDHWGQLVFECRVRPNSFRQCPGSLRNKYWKQSVRFDPNFDSMKDLEWLISNPGDVVVTGLMVREFGSMADPLVYGHSAQQVHAGSHGPEFEWTRLREKEFEQQGLVVKD